MYNMLLLFSGTLSTTKKPQTNEYRTRPYGPTVLLSRHESKACVVSALQEPAKPPAASLGRD